VVKTILMYSKTKMLVCMATDSAKKFPNTCCDISFVVARYINGELVKKDMDEKLKMFTEQLDGAKARDSSVLTIMSTGEMFGTIRKITMHSLIPINQFTLVNDREEQQRTRDQHKTSTKKRNRQRPAETFAKPAQNNETGRDQQRPAQNQHKTAKPAETRRETSTKPAQNSETGRDHQRPVPPLHEPPTSVGFTIRYVCHNIMCICVLCTPLWLKLFSFIWTRCRPSWEALSCA
jgi:hypothetical protein